MSVSKTIIERIEGDGKRYWANDNISEYIKQDEVAPLIDEVAANFEVVLRSLLIDTKTDPNSEGTARRLAKMYINEILRGRYFPQPNVTAFPNEGTDEYTGMIVIRAEIRSICSHHHQPVQGICYIGIIPDGKVLGLSKYIRLAQWHASRGTLQEELTTRIAKSISELTGSNHIAVHIAATHGCCENRGVMAHSSLTQTTVLKGAFIEDAGVKKEFFDKVKMQENR